MMYTFNREGKGPKDWSKTNTAMAHTLDLIRDGGCQEEEMKSFLLQAVKDASVSEEKEMAFWAYADVASMPADARCEYVYQPTYLMTLAIVSIINKHPEFMKLAGVEETLHYAMNACAGRGLQGSGYEAYEGLCNNVLLFMKNGIIRFMKDWPLFSTQFEGVFRNALNGIERDYRAGKYADDCWGSNCESVQKEIIQLRHETARR